MQLTAKEKQILREIGQRTGAAGGKQAAKNMTKAERIARAKTAVQAREAKRKEAR